MYSHAAGAELGEGRDRPEPERIALDPQLAQARRPNGLRGTSAPAGSAFGSTNQSSPYGGGSPISASVPSLARPSSRTGTGHAGAAAVM